MSHTLLKQASAKPATCKIIFQTSEDLMAQITIFVSQLDTDLVTENKWRVLESAELLVLLPQDTRVSETLSEWLEN